MKEENNTLLKRLDLDNHDLEILGDKIKIENDNIRFVIDDNRYTFMYINNDGTENKAGGIFVEYLDYDEDNNSIIIDEYYDEFTLSYLYGLCRSIKGIMDTVEQRKIGNYGLIPDKEKIYNGNINYNELSMYLKDNEYFVNKILGNDLELKKEL